MEGVSQRSAADTAEKNTGLANEEAVPARALMRGRALWYAPLVRACSWLAAALTVAVIAFGWLAHTGARLDWYDYARMSSMLSLAGIAIFLFVFWRVAGKINQKYRAHLQRAADLAEATGLLIAVSDNTSDPIFVTNRQGLLIFANPAMLRLVGKTREQAMHRCSRELFTDQGEADLIDRDDQRIMHSGQAVTLEQTLHLPHGVRTYASTKAPWFDRHGQVMGVIGISTDITQRKLTEDSLKQREAQLEATIVQRTTALRKLTNHLETVREEEKRAIARELHDDMGAALTALSMHLESAYKLFPDDPLWHERKARIHGLLKSVVTTTRRIQTDLRPNMLDLFGLKAAINELAEEFEKRSNIVCRASLPDEELTLDPKLEIVLYRMLQETLSNVAKHAQARRVDLILDVDEDRVALTVRDDGIGIAPERRDNTSTYGLRGLYERAEFLGGKVAIVANQQRGTTVTIALPLTPPGP
ncbi:PAS domain-containing protein [Undibacterium arcticum]|uniref:histidine kinase n=2 Tax=Undibacterium arcticum TaxID=1762892 RepID=A0ABV7FAU5_9BURK